MNALSSLADIIVFILANYCTINLLFCAFFSFFLFMFIYLLNNQMSVLRLTMLVFLGKYIYILTDASFANLNSIHTQLHLFVLLSIIFLLLFVSPMLYHFSSFIFVMCYCCSTVFHFQAYNFLSSCSTNNYTCRPSPPSI